ncbi:hypothetical protein cce_5093 [Crocosphaera subtropica ATCC 51142]|uniref:MACPF domain-containing protein n=1 Tax=Crocosphaera subtropica (strain ATCC 51142 / BH68) TaxID=43989 RepID=B1X2S8_CROS5|nr:hypothetical protein [Crocosphaera subtropica]ACB54439.1 hypothetical protein cce_5093 [Crocosphaera subtropica ATCC 51142]
MLLTHESQSLDMANGASVESEINVSPTNLALSTPQTTLEGTLANIPWTDGFTLGSGVDVIKGSLLGSALKSFTPNLNPIKTSSESYRFISDDSSLNLEIGVSASGIYNFNNIKITASTEFLTQITYSQTSITLIAEYSSLFGYSDQPINYQLTEKAQELAKNPGQFRQAYGDYFIADSQRGSRFLAVYVCETSSAESLVEFKASLGAEVPKVFSAEGSNRLMQAASEHHVSISTYLYPEGYTGTAPSGPWNPQTILEALKWFKANEKGENMKAELKHYSTIIHGYPRTIPVDSRIFVELSHLYNQLWDIRARYDSLPKYYQHQYKLPFNTLNLGIVSNQDTLVTNPTLRKSYQQQAQILKADLDDVVARRDFYFEVQESLKNNPEPPANHKINESKGVNKWLYGFDRYLKSDAVVIHTTVYNFRKGPKPAIHTQHTFEFGPESRYRIVGWEVVSNRIDGHNGSWRKIRSQILLTDYAGILVESGFDRAMNWSLIVHYVEAKDYQFE